MTAPLIVILGVLFAYAIYIATLSARAPSRPGDFLDAGQTLPPWTFIFAGAGVVLAGLGLFDHLMMLALFGLQYGHVAVGLVLAAMTAALVQKRVWLAARLSGLRTIGDLMGDYFDSRSLRIYFLVILFLFAVPFAAYALSRLGGLIESATSGDISASLAIWVTAFFLFLFSVLGGWRAVVYVVAAQAFLVLTLLLFIGGFAGTALDGLAFLSKGVSTPEAIPGVIQFTDGIGKEVPVGGLWTTVAILSFALSLLGIVLSPAFGFLGNTTEAKRGFAFGHVWMIGGLVVGTLVLLAPILATELEPAAGLPDFSRLASLDRLAAVSFLVLLVASLQLGVAFFAASGANIATIELVGRYVLPEMTEGQTKLAARIAMAAAYGTVALTAAYAPLSVAIVSSLTLSLAAQALPAFLGLCWIPWISRSGVLAGLVLGTILVVFTEPLGLVVFEALFVDLPWGRWPLTVHSAGWGLVFNVGACLLVSLFTRAGPEREHRQLLHDAFALNHPARFGGRASRAAKWSLVLIWAFFALGPGAILGNHFFSRPIFAGGGVELGLPSLFVWQVLFWLLGVFLVWWLAYQTRMSVIEEEPGRRLVLRPPVNRLYRPPSPRWIARLVGRLAER